MVKTIEANLIGTDLKIGIVVGRFNDFINAKLVDGAIDGLKRHGVAEESIEVAWVLVYLKYHLLQKKWQIPKNTMQSLVWVQ